jgi:16S rRNA processing protein RimM
MNQKDYFKIGYIAKTHGLKGELTMAMMPECPDPEGIKSFFVEINQNLVPFFIQSISVKGDKAFVKFEDVNTIDEANVLKGCSLFLAKTEREKLGRGEFYNDEVVGFEVTDNDAGILGVVREVFESGPNRFLMIDWHEKEVMIPINGPFIKSINKSKKKISVELPEGFLEI